MPTLAELQDSYLGRLQLFQVPSVCFLLGQNFFPCPQHAGTTKSTCETLRPSFMVSPLAIRGDAAHWCIFFSPSLPCHLLLSQATLSVCALPSPAKPCKLPLQALSALGSGAQQGMHSQVISCNSFSICKTSSMVSLSLYDITLLTPFESIPPVLPRCHCAH